MCTVNEHLKCTSMVEEKEKEETKAQRTSLSVDDICSLLSLCLEATYLVFEGRVYQ